MLINTILMWMYVSCIAIPATIWLSHSFLLLLLFRSVVIARLDRAISNNVNEKFRCGLFSSDRCYVIRSHFQVILSLVCVCILLAFLKICICLRQFGASLSNWSTPSACNFSLQLDKCLSRACQRMQFSVNVAEIFQTHCYSIQNLLFVQFGFFFCSSFVLHSVSKFAGALSHKFHINQANRDR